MASSSTKNGSAEDSGENPEVKASGGGGLSNLIPTIIAVVLAPVLSWAVVNFLMLPRLTQDLKVQLAAAMATEATKQGDEAEHSGPKGEAASGGHGGDAKTTLLVRPKFENLTANIAGTQGTRYLKMTFILLGKNAAANRAIDQKNAELVDASLSLISSLSMAELDDAGSKGLVRGRLVAAFNEILKAPMVEQLLFTDFVIQ